MPPSSFLLPPASLAQHKQSKLLIKGAEDLLMLSHLPTTQSQLVQRLKARGPQSIKILAAQLELTTMGVRQHLAQLLAQGYVKHAQLSHQTRGRPVTLWKLTQRGHELFADAHATLAVTFIEEATRRVGLGEIAQWIASTGDLALARYQSQLPDPAEDLNATLEALCVQRSAEGFMAELRLTPSGWLLIENHCPLAAAAKACAAFCADELHLFKALLAPHAQVERGDHLLSGSRRCAYRIQATQDGIARNDKLIT